MSKLIGKYNNYSEGRSLHELSELRLDMVKHLRDLNKIPEDVYVKYLTKNRAVASYKIQNEVHYLYSHSQISESTHELYKFFSFTLLPQSQKFTTLVLDSSGKHAEVWDRNVDTEAKILEYIFEEVRTKGITGVLEVNLYTRYYPCDSCDGVIDQFVLETALLGINTSIEVYYDIVGSRVRKIREAGAWTSVWKV
ncbi:deaminase domain-containing protein [Paenibacillus paridis]|uniref:deaminase domain-containing protein n=1 Tax=Paenibacillus paridis TaxID=2583376 RepID=UPI00112049D4|nr:deaminase domain-containing protein [Paenibacillus paridis]